MRVSKIIKLSYYQKTRRNTVVWWKINMVLITKTSNQPRWTKQLDFFLGTGSRNNRFFASQYNNATTSAHIRRAFPRESYCACACTRIAYSKKLIALTARIPWHFFPRNHQIWRLGKGKVNRLFMFFSHCDAPALISFVFFLHNIKWIISLTNDNNTLHTEQGCVGVFDQVINNTIYITFIVHIVSWVFDIFLCNLYVKSSLCTTLYTADTHTHTHSHTNWYSFYEVYGCCFYVYASFKKVLVVIISLPIQTKGVGYLGWMVGAALSVWRGKRCCSWGQFFWYVLS